MQFKFPPEVSAKIAAKAAALQVTPDQVVFSALDLFFAGSNVCLKAPVVACLERVASIRGSCLDDVLEAAVVYGLRDSRHLFGVDVEHATLCQDIEALS